MSGKRVLITGGAGFLGSHVTDRAMREGFDVYVLDNLYTGTMDNIEHHLGHPRFHFIQHDVRFPLPAEVTAVKFDLIFHLACAASPVHYQADPIGTTMTCVVGTESLLREALRCGCPILISSTSEVYGDPTVHPQPESYWGNVNCTGIRSCYDEGKRCAEALCFDYHRRHGVKIRVARIFNTYGPRMCFNDGRIISNFLVQALQGENITVFGTGEYTRSFQFCDDLVEGFWRLIHHPTEIGPVNLGNPEEYKVIDMAQKIQAMVAGTASQIVHLPAAQDDPKQRRPDISKAKAVLDNWEPKINVGVGLQRTMENFAARLAKESIRIKAYVQCNPLLDISSHVDAAFQTKYNITAPAALVTPEQMGIYAELEARKDVQYIPGGSGLNTARVAQWMSQAPKGSFMSYVGCIGNDARGNTLKSAAEGEGVNMCLQYSKANETGVCGVTIVGNERYLVTNLAAANDLTTEHLDTQRVQRALGGAQLFYLTGFTLTLKLESVLKVAKHSHRTGGVFMMNLSAPFIVQFFGEPLGKALPYVDVLFANDEEARAFATTKGWDTADLKDIAVRAAKLPKIGSRPRIVVFTQGKNPTVYATADGAHEVAVQPIDVAKIIDTNGAGDAFVGGFLAGMAREKSIAQCCAAGNYAAGVIIQHDGCTFPEKPSYQL